MYRFIPDSVLLSPVGAHTHPVGYKDGYMVNCGGLQIENREGLEDGVCVGGEWGLLLFVGVCGGGAEVDLADRVGVGLAVLISKIAPCT